MTELHIRRAAKADLPFMVKLIAHDEVGGPSDSWNAESPAIYEAAFDVIARESNQELFVAELDGRLVGTFQLTYIPGIMRKGMRRGLVESVHITPEERDKGLGSAMMRWAIARCRERGCGLVQLTSNKARPDAHRFYRALGFTQSHEGFRLFL